MCDWRWKKEKSMRTLINIIAALSVSSILLFTTVQV